MKLTEEQIQVLMNMYKHQKEAFLILLGTPPEESASIYQAILDMVLEDF
jgi:hypothetical protein